MSNIFQTPKCWQLQWWNNLPTFSWGIYGSWLHSKFFSQDKRRKSIWIGWKFSAHSTSFDLQIAGYYGPRSSVNELKVNYIYWVYIFDMFTSLQQITLAETWNHGVTDEMILPPNAGMGCHKLYVLWFSVYLYCYF